MHIVILRLTTANKISHRLTVLLCLNDKCFFQGINVSNKFRLFFLFF